MKFHSFLLVSLLFPPVPAYAELPNEERQIVLHPQDGDGIVVATVAFAAVHDVITYEIVWDDTKFGDYFLSMRPFKCLKGMEKLWCRVPYPYAIKREVTQGDLVDLEYDLLFVWKNANEYGIDLWNGVYYRLSDEGNELVGAMNDIDLNTLASPPEGGSFRPVSQNDLEEADPDSHWLPRLTIK